MHIEKNMSCNILNDNFKNIYELINEIDFIKKEFIYYLIIKNIY